MEELRSREPPRLRFRLRFPKEDVARQKFQLLMFESYVFGSLRFALLSRFCYPCFHEEEKRLPKTKTTRCQGVYKI